jgi:serine/threonine protein kinase
LFEKKGLDSLAVDQHRLVLNAQPDPSFVVEAAYSLGSILERQGRTREAAANYRRVVALDLRYKDAAARLERLEHAGQDTTRTERGRSVPQRYKVETPLPERTPGSAWLARDTVMERQVVLRRFGPDTALGDRAVERLLSDVRRIARLHHPAIAVVHDAVRQDDFIYLVEEYVPGRTLAGILRQEGVLDVPRAVQILTRLAEALDYAHGLGLLAKNIRPDTIVVTPSGEAKLIDFGLALRRGDGFSAPHAYRPPELGRNERLDPSSDIYLLGVVAWEMLVGAPPPPPRPDQKEPPQLPFHDSRPIPDVLRRVISECLTPDRSTRLGSAQKLLEELHGTSLLPGVLLANRYEILREIGRGGMGTVFASRDLVLDEPVALKVLAGVLDESIEKRFIQEIRLTRQINHPNVVRVHTFERWRGLRFIVMEYIDGVDLRRWVEGRRPIPLGQALDLLAGVAAGLAAAHRLGIVHRDVKPENVLVDPAGHPRLVDFGIARQGDVRLTSEGLVMGSPAYMAPEQIRGEPVDQRADLYALGVLAFFLIAGREPFDSDKVPEVLRAQLEAPPPSLSALRRDTTPSIEDLVFRAMAKDPAHRPGSALEFLERLTLARAGLSAVTA